MRHCSRPKAAPILLFMVFLSPCVAVRARDPLHTAINGPCQLASDATGNLYVSEEHGNRVLRIDWKRKTVEVMAGNGKECCFKEDSPARQSSVYHVYSIAVDPEGRLYLGGRNRRDGAFLRIVDPSSGRIKSVAKGRAPVSLEGVPMRDADLSDPHGIAALRRNLLFVSASTFNEIVELDDAAVTFAGTRQEGFSGDGGPALEARFNWPASLALDGGGNLYAADYHNHRIRRINIKTREVITVAGNGSETSSGDGGLAVDAGVRYPFAIAVDAQGDTFVIENGAHTVRRIDAATGIITRFAGTAEEGYSGDGGPAKSAKLNACGIALDPAGNLYISDLAHNRIRRVDARTGIITTVAGNGRPKRQIVLK